VEALAPRPKSAGSMPQSGIRVAHEFAAVTHLAH